LIDRLPNSVDYPPTEYPVFEQTLGGLRTIRRLYEARGFEPFRVGVVKWLMAASRNGMHWLLGYLQRCSDQVPPPEEVGAAPVTPSAKTENIKENRNERVFIGHGQSPLWRELKDFVQDRLELEWDEFNRVPVAGVTNIGRLSEMLDAAGVAFLLVTGEDELVDGTMQARMNVVHEAGLFQGKLGFGRAIILLEEGCKEFSNIQGLGQIRFPKGNIKAAFEEISGVLEREGILSGYLRGRK